MYMVLRPSLSSSRPTTHLSILVCSPMSNMSHLRRWLSDRGVPWSLTDSELQLELLRGSVEDGAGHETARVQARYRARPDLHLAQNLRELQIKLVDVSIQTEGRVKVSGLSPPTVSTVKDYSSDYFKLVEDFEVLKVEKERGEEGLRVLERRLRLRESECKRLRDRVVELESAGNGQGPLSVIPPPTASIVELQPPLQPNVAQQADEEDPSPVPLEGEVHVCPTPVLNPAPRAVSVKVHVGWVGGLDPSSSATVRTSLFYLELNLFTNPAMALAVAQTQLKPINEQGLVRWDREVKLCGTYHGAAAAVCMKLTLFSSRRGGELFREGTVSFRLQPFDHRREFNMKDLSLEGKARRLLLIIGPVEVS